jgi:magnesium transporter
VYSQDLHRAVLGAYFLNEELGVFGKVGCAICLLGSVIIVLHAPPDEEIVNVGQILDYALRPGQCSMAQYLNQLFVDWM